MANEIPGVDHVELIENTTATEYKQSNVLGYSQALNFGHNEIDELLVELACRLDYENLTGNSLDIVGKIVGQPRLQLTNTGTRLLTDVEYILYIKAKIIKNHTHSTPEENIAAYSNLLGGISMIAEDANPGGGQAGFIFLETLTPEQIGILQNKETLPKTAGVSYYFNYLPAGGEVPFFGFAGFPGAGPFGDDNDAPLVGGTFPEYIP